MCTHISNVHSGYFRQCMPSTQQNCAIPILCQKYLLCNREALYQLNDVQHKFQIIANREYWLQNRQPVAIHSLINV